MNIVFFAHPFFLGHQSMPRYANLLATGLRERGHHTEIWQPLPKFHRLPLLTFIDKKWLGYIDQYVLFPEEVTRKIQTVPSDTLFVFTDNALGPWVPLAVDRPHVVHCHDFLAQFSALRKIPQNPTGWSGRQYQAYIRRGYTQAKHFICVSNKTKSDLLKLLPQAPHSIDVVYNGLNRPFERLSVGDCRKNIGDFLNRDLTHGYILHVGGNQWYKNRIGVLEIYQAWRHQYGGQLPLLMVGQEPTQRLRQIRDESPFRDDIYFLSKADDNLIQIAYSGAGCLLFPSYAEGFGWPIAEALASGCPVITTDELPMTEVGGDSVYYIPNQPTDHTEVTEWISKSSGMLQHVLTLSAIERQGVVERGMVHARQFSTVTMLDTIEKIYQSLLAKTTSNTLNS